MTKGKTAKKRKNSLIFNRFYRFVNRLYRAASDSFIASVLTLYYFAADGLKSCRIGRAFTEKNRFSSFLSGARNKATNLLLRGRPTRFVKKQAERLPFTQTRDIGIFLFSFGLYTAAVYLVKKYALSVFSADNFVFYVGCACVLLSLFFMSKRSIAATVNRSGLLSFIVYEILCLDKDARIPEEALYKNSSISLFTGMMSGLFTVVINPVYYLAAFIIALLLYTILRRPEAGVMIMLASLPFVPVLYLMVLCGVTCAAYLLKVLSRRRSFGFSPIDLSVLLFLLLTACGNIGSVSYGGSEALSYALLIVGYFLCRNLLNTRGRLVRAMKALAVSGFAAACCALFVYLFGTELFNPGDYTLFSGVYSGVSLFFGSSPALSSYLLLCAPFMYYMYGSRGGSRFYPAAALAVMIAALFATYNVGAWIGGAVAFILISLLYKKRTAINLVRLVPLAVAVSFLPSSVWNFISVNIASCDAGLPYKLKVMAGTLRMSAANFLGGTGLSDFGFIYPTYAENGCACAESSYSLYLQIMSALGIFGLLAFLLIILLYVSLNLSYLKASLYTKSKYCIYAPLTAVCAVLLSGLTNCVIDDMRVFFLFFAVLGIGAAACRLGKEETEYKLDTTYGFALYLSCRAQDDSGKETENDD